MVLREEGGRQIGSEGVEVGRAGKLLRGHFHQGLGLNFSMFCSHADPSARSGVILSLPLASLQRSFSVRTDSPVSTAVLSWSVRHGLLQTLSLKPELKTPDCKL